MHYITLLLHMSMQWINPLTAELSWRWLIHFYLTWFCSLPVLQDRPSQSGWTTCQFSGVYQVCHHCMLTQSTQLGCSCAWVLAFTQTHKLVQFMLIQKPHKHYNEGKGLCPFEPCCEEGTSPSCTPRLHILAQGHTENPWIFPKICYTYLVIFTHLDHSLRKLSFFK